MPQKRHRADVPTPQPLPTKAPNRQTVFSPFRALGLITNHVPFVLQTRTFKGSTEGPKIHLLTCLGRSWAIWEGGKMTLLFVGPELEIPITSMAMDNDAVWVAAGPDTIKYHRGKEVGRLSEPLGSRLASLLVFGSQLLALTEDGKRVVIWNTVEQAFQCHITLNQGFMATHIMHPATYINKIVVAGRDGSLQIWNTRTQSCIHTFTAADLLTSPDRNCSTPITALSQSPAIDVLAIGFASGEISVYDIRADERLMHIFTREGAVSALGFRADGQHILASGSTAGHITLWDLSTNGRLLHTLHGAHDGSIAALHWVPGQPILMSSGEDNSIKQWLFDSPTAPPRLLKQRSGHHAPPHLIRFYGDDGKQLLSASQDRSLRCTSVVRDSRSFELSQGSLAKKAASRSVLASDLKAPPVTALSYSAARWKDWDDIVTAHENESIARTWSLLNKRRGKLTFKFESTGKTDAVGSVKSVCVSACGNFALAGTSTGTIGIWNMQSGVQRKTFRVGPHPSNPESRSNERSVTGIATDELNRIIIASTLDGTINFFDFHSCDLKGTLVFNTSITSITLQRDSGLLAAICDDLVVRLIDIETQRLVREFGGFAGRILDLTFSPDSRWIVTTALDSIIRTFDIPTGRMIDAFRSASVATSVAFSPTSDFLATSHVGSVGIYLWTNRAQYSDVSSHSIKDEDIVEVTLPSFQGTEDEKLGTVSALAGAEDQEYNIDFYASTLDGDLITLTHLPRSRWQTLLNLEVIHQRNGPKAPPKAPESAPFFLPSIPSTDPQFVVEKESKKTNQPRRRLRNALKDTDSAFVRSLCEEDENGDYEAFFNRLKMFAPATADAELRSLSSPELHRLFLHALTQRLHYHRDFEAVQTYMNVFLRVHGDALVSDPEVRFELEGLVGLQQKESDRVLKLISSSLGIIAFVRDTL